MRQRLQELLEGTPEAQEQLAREFIRTAAQLVAQELLEEEVTDFLDRGHYKRRPSHARGLSTRDIEDALREATGDVMVSRTAGSQVTDRLWEATMFPFVR